MIFQDATAGLAMPLMVALIVAPIASQNKPAIQRAGQVFQKSCAKCHVVPDPAVRTDRSWLDQVNRTA